MQLIRKNFLNISSQRLAQLNKYNSLKEAWDKTDDLNHLRSLIKIADIDSKYYIKVAKAWLNDPGVIEWCNEQIEADDFKELRGILKNWICSDDSIDSVLNLKQSGAPSNIQIICELLYSPGYVEFWDFISLTANMKSEEALENIIKRVIPNPFIPEAERLELDQNTKDVWGDTLEEI